ncbi:conserved hypothetical protein [Burkholderia pseudomallei MSHR346]|nr:conserved hypothetical protein [Burkholderia pseudomallei MSHR346]
MRGRFEARPGRAFFGSAHEPVKDSRAIAQPDAGLARRAAGK